MNEVESLAPQYVGLDQQREASVVGVWVFLSTEVLFFGGLFLAYACYRVTYAAEFSEVSKQTNVILGSVNTGILLTSSLFMALAAQEAEKGRRQQTLVYLASTLFLGVAFLGVKAFEYHEDFSKGFVPAAQFTAAGGPKQLFIWFYYAMTGIHALHLLIGISLVGWLIQRIFFARQSSFEMGTRAHVIGLYWHFVDVIWVFLYPLLYLVDRHTS